MTYPLSPLDGRYAEKVKAVAHIFSEFGLARARTKVEISWLMFLSAEGIAPKISRETAADLMDLFKSFSDEDFARIKEIEKKTNHDVKAVEIFLQEFVPEELWPWIHFGCTSEDINSTSYALMLQQGTEELKKFILEITADLRKKSQDWKNVPMLSRTHGQTATPTTLGKEFCTFLVRTEKVLKKLEGIEFPAKFSGATGNFAAHKVAITDKNWPELSRKFVEERLGLTWNGITTQIEPHDNQAELLNEISRVSTIWIDLSRDIWGYVSLGYFGQKTVAGEVGSSTMPHKVNPIDFENAEGNLKLARGIARTLSDELPVSRWQRDLTDSTLQRNLGLVFGHFLLAGKSLKKGLGKLELREDNISRDLQNAPEVLTEAVQTVMRAHGQADAYDQLKAFSRGKALSLEEIREFIAQTDLPKEAKENLAKLTPETYTGYSAELVDLFLE
jgi:adenylosuccinate lyase